LLNDKIFYFYFQQISEFWPGGSDKIKEGIGSAFRTILEKKVLQSLDPVLEIPKLEPELRTSIQDVLLPLIRRDQSDPSQAGNNGNGLEIKSETSESLSLNYSTSGTQNDSNIEANHIKTEVQSSYSVPIVDLEPDFSDGEEDEQDDEQDEDDEETSSLKPGIFQAIFELVL
jgi:hypothetical protein